MSNQTLDSSFIDRIEVKLLELELEVQVQQAASYKTAAAVRALSQLSRETLLPITTQSMSVAGI